MHFQRTVTLAAVATLCGCAHSAMTGDEHRAEAEAAREEAKAEAAQYNPAASAMRSSGVPATVRGTAGEVIDPASLEFWTEYNPTQGHLVEADRQMQHAFEHLKAADQLEKYEDAACQGESVPERRACPLLAPHIASVKENKRGVLLQLKPTAPATRLTAQLQCHLAFARAHDFVQAPCPLFIKGVGINLKAGTHIEVASADPVVAESVRRQARVMFGEAAVKP